MTEQRTGGQKMTMQERIDAFYRQSGGPNNPRIKQYLDQHLMYGKDHGMPGYRETVEDAFIDMVISDPSLLILFQRLQRLRHGNATAAQQHKVNRDEDMKQVQSELSELRKEVQELRRLLEQSAAER